jgi:hypothetical protein
VASDGEKAEENENGNERRTVSRGGRRTREERDERTGGEARDETAEIGNAGARRGRE